MKKKAVLVSASSYFLGFVQVFVDGVSSATQIKDFTPARWAKGAAFGASLVEGEIYRKNIAGGITKFCLLGKKALWEHIVIQAFEAELESIEKFEKELKEKLCKFLREIRAEQTRYKLAVNEQEDLDAYISSIENGLLGEGELDSLNFYLSSLSIKYSNSFEYLELAEIKHFNFFKEAFEKLKKAKQNNDCLFLTSYKANKDFLVKSKLFKADEAAVEKAENQLKILIKTLLERVAYPEEGQFSDIFDENLHLVESVSETETGDEEDYVFISNPTQEMLETSNLPEINPILIMKLQKELARGKGRLWPLRLGMIFSIVAGIAVGVVLFYTFPAVLLALGLSLSLTSLWVTIPMGILAVFASLSYALLIYNTIAHLIINETLSKWWKKLNIEIEQKYGSPGLLKYILLVVAKTIAQCFIKLINWSKRKQDENWFAYSMRIVLSLAVISLGIVSALTVGYTTFIQLQPYVGTAVCIITALPLLVSDLIFTLKNSFESVVLLTRISLANVISPIKAGWKDLTEQLQKENYLQITLHLVRLPLRFLLFIFKTTIFLFHIFFASVSSDRLFNLPCWLALGFTMGSEILTDICPLFGESKGHHDHGGLFAWVAKLIFIVPATLLGIFNCIASLLNFCFRNPNLKVLGPWEAIQQEWEQFDIRHRHAHTEEENTDQTIELDKEAQLPTQIALKEVIQACDKEIKRLGSGFFKSAAKEKKAEIFSGYKAALIAHKAGGKIPSEGLISAEKKAILATHRFGIFKGETESIKQLKKMHRWSIEKDSDSSAVQSNGYTNGHARCA